VYLHLIIVGILSLCISAHLTLLNPVLNLTFSLLPITLVTHIPAPQNIQPSTIGAILIFD